MVKTLNCHVFYTYEEILNLLERKEQRLVQFFARVRDVLANYLICEHPFKKEEKRVLVYVGGSTKALEKLKGQIIRIFGEIKSNEESFILSLRIQFLPQDPDLIKQLEYVLSIEKELLLKELIKKLEHASE